MTDHDKQKKKREAARLRKQKQRARQKEHREACGAEVINLEIYYGTRQQLDALMAEGGYTEQSEVMTLLINGAARLLERDKSQLKELLRV